MSLVRRRDDVCDDLMQECFGRRMDDSMEPRAEVTQTDGEVGVKMDPWRVTVTVPRTRQPQGHQVQVGVG
jgi:hypothetical protein